MWVEAIGTIPQAQRDKPGALLSVIPDRDLWERFISDVRAVWPIREAIFSLKPACQLFLYDGIAFYEFVSGNFWDGFAKTVGALEMPVNRQSEINREFAYASHAFGLPTIPHAFVSSSVSHIGIPISMWDAFLQVCEWALWNNDWTTLDDDVWHDALDRRLGGRKRLINFLVENRKTASALIREMLDARGILNSDPKLTLADLAQASILRREYFEEVPETADFLRERDPDSLFSDRARLSWNEERSTLSLHLPPVPATKLPAVWHLSGREQPATGTAAEMVVQGVAFAPLLRLELKSSGGSAWQRIAGIDDWALYDDVKRRFVNRDRDLLPVAQYTLLSRHPLSPELEGWAHDPEDSAIDIPHRLVDGTPVHLTRLYPESRRPRLKIGDGRWLNFAQRRGVALRVFCGTRQSEAARFGLAPNGTVRVEKWPRPFLEVPLSLVREEDIADEFTVFLDGRRALGKWVTYEFDPPGADVDQAERAFCYWQWQDPPLPLPPKPPVVHHALAALDSRVLAPVAPSWLGDHVLYVESRRLGRICFGQATECKVQMLAHTKDSLWPQTWGDYLVWVLLSQVQDEATWEEVRLARDAVAMWATINLSPIYHLIRKLEHRGFLVTRGHRYQGFQSRVVLSTASNGECHGTYCGLTTKLYEIVRAAPPVRLQINPMQWGCPPTLGIHWVQHQRQTVIEACGSQGIECVRNLW